MFKKLLFDLNYKILTINKYSSKYLIANILGRNLHVNHICKIKTKPVPNLGLRSDKNKISPLGWFLLAVPITTFSLGCWQVKRKTWKENLIKELEYKTQINPVPLPENLDDLQDMEYRSVILKGTFKHEKEIYLGPRSFIQVDGAESRGGLFSQQNQSNGYLVITPLKLSGRNETVLVNRGWVPRKLLNPQTRINGQIEGEVELVGVVRKGEKRPQFSPDHRGDIYLYRDLERMCRVTESEPYFFDASYTSTVPNGPIGGQTRVNLRNEHLSYLITWFSLSAATSYMWYQQILTKAIK
ncbi:SURF1-like protein [Condylostylus longicornis]|uniref:SURF1-like protein n=1 Tax=Condylostylus longicornis TaxID=2530218 RepID=UPI00244DCA82|nr:SURF1-like protein [Condylostylus longicornis]